jgi:hypothetical protein
MDSKVMPTVQTERTQEEAMKSCFLMIARIEWAAIVIVLKFFLLRIFLAFNLSISSSQENIFSLFEHLESQIHMKGLGGFMFLYGR